MPTPDWVRDAQRENLQGLQLLAAQYPQKLAVVDGKLKVKR